MFEVDKKFTYFIQQNKRNDYVGINSYKLNVEIFYDKEEHGENFKSLKSAIESVINSPEIFINPISFFVDTRKEVGNFIKKCFDLKKFEYSIEVEEYNRIVNSKSDARISVDKKYIIMRFISGLFFIVNRITFECLIYVCDNIEAISMLNLLVVSPFVFVGELYVAHAGLVTNGERYILLYNDSLGGKTSFGFLFLSNGWDIVAEDVVYFDNRGHIVDFLFRKYFHVRVGTEVYFSKLFKTKQKKCFDKRSKKELFELGKEKQSSIPYTDLCVRKYFSKENAITDVIMVNIDKDKKENYIVGFSNEILINKIVEICNMPTITVFKKMFPKLEKISMEQQRNELVKCMKNVKSYKVDVGLEYKDFFDEILEWITKE